MAQVNVDVTVDKGAVTAMLDRAVRALTPPTIGEVAGHGADELVTAAKLSAPRRSGALARSIDKHQTGDASFEVGPDESIPYARIQEFGGDIVPRTAKALRFEVGGHVIFAQHVRIPGQHYMRNAADVGAEAAVEAVRAALDRAIGD